jgi:NAD(P)-dependent dehydrogenase (short-subunit alcohol dehydrogenase family)
MLPAAGRVVLISGANRGIGRAVAERLHRDGYTISLGVRRTQSVEPLLAFMDAARCLVAPYDARDRKSAHDWVAATVARFGRIDGVVANAGIARPFTLEGDDEGPLDEMWEVNAKGPYRLINAAFRHLKAAGSGRVVTVVSLSGKRVKSTLSTGYAMSKFAATALTHAVRQAGWEHGIRATALCPGFVRTEMAAAAARTLAPEQMIDPETIAALVSILLALPNNAAVSELPVNCMLETAY